MRPKASGTSGNKLFEPHDVVVVDLRSPSEFAQGHLKGALSLPFSAKGLAERLAVVLDPGTRISLLATRPAVAAAGAEQLRDRYHVAGVMDCAWRQANVPVESLPDLPVQALAKAGPSDDLTVLDVREPVEWETGYAPGAVLISLGSLREHLEVVSDQALVAVICEAGVRSSTGASLLQATGFTKVATVSDGMSGYRRAGFSLEFPESPADSRRDP